MHRVINVQKQIRRAARAGALVVSSALTIAWSAASHQDISTLPAKAGSPSPPDSATVVEIRSTGVELSFDRPEIVARAGERLTIRYTNESTDLAHNIVLLRQEEDIRPVGIAALKAHASDYIPSAEMARIIAYSELAAPGETVEFTFEVPPAGTYPFICTYSGHFTMMQGRLNSTN